MDAICTVDVCPAIAGLVIFALRGMTVLRDRDSRLIVLEAEVQQGLKVSNGRNEFILRALTM